MTVYPPAVRRPPLSPTMRRSARIAGGVGFPLMSIGWSLFSVAALTGILWASLSAIFRFIAARDERFRGQLDRVLVELGRLPLGLIAGLLVLAGLVGAGIWVAGLFTSRGILRRSGHPRPWAVTWAGLGLGIVASWIIGGVVQFVSQILSAIGTVGAGSGDDRLGTAIGLAVGGGIVAVVILIAGHIVAGVFLWWWMAYAMRPAAVSLQPAVASAATPPTA